MSLSSAPTKLSGPSPAPIQSALLSRVDYSNTTLNLNALPAWGIEEVPGIPAQPVWGLAHRSFYHLTATNEVSLPIWFDTDATIRVPTGKHSSEALLLNIINPADEEKPLQIDVNGEILFADTIPPGNWCQFFPLPTKNTEDVFIRLSRPSRELLLLRGITLLDHVPGVFHGTYSTDPLTPSGYRSRLTLISPHYPKTLMRGTMGTPSSLRHKCRRSTLAHSVRNWECPGRGATRHFFGFPMHAADRGLSLTGR